MAEGLVRHAPDGGPGKEKRSKNGCGLCRARRIKCDEVHPSCGQCVKRGFECVYDPGAAAKVDINFALARRRSRAACTSCRTLKRRCTAAEGDDKICSRCKRLGLTCEWSRPKPRRRSRRDASYSLDQDGERDMDGSDSQDGYGDGDGERDRDRDRDQALHAFAPEERYGDDRKYDIGMDEEGRSRSMSPASPGSKGRRFGDNKPISDRVGDRSGHGFEYGHGYGGGGTSPRQRRSSALAGSASGNLVGSSKGDHRRGGAGKRARIEIEDIPPFEALLADRMELHTWIKGFFGTVHQFGFLTYIHEPSFFRLLERGKAPMDLTKIMVALSMRFTGDMTSHTLRQADRIYDEVFPRLRNQMYESFGAIELMSVLLAREYDQARGNFHASWMMWGNAVRIMQFLSLHTFDETYPQPHAVRLNPLLKPEALRRLAWAVFYLDTQADAGRHGVHTVTETGYHLQLPADETNFMRGIDVITAPLEKHPSSRVFAASASPLPWESPAGGSNAQGSTTGPVNGGGSQSISTDQNQTPRNTNINVNDTNNGGVVVNGNAKPTGNNSGGTGTPGSTSGTGSVNNLALAPPPPNATTTSNGTRGSFRNPNMGIASHLIRTAAMRRRILHFNSLLKYSRATPTQMINSLQYLENDLRTVITDLPPDLTYSEDALFVHSERRTMFVLLHMLRHNCFLMLLWAKLNVASRCPDPPDSTMTLMQERIKHAFGVAGIVADAVRLNIVVDPFVGVQAYTSLEVLLFDPLRCVRIDPTGDPKAPRFAKALSPLLELMRRLCPVDYTMRHLRVEACRRMARCGFGDILIHADWEACKMSPITGQPDSEFDFRFFKWHRVEQARRSRLSLGTSQAAEALLDLGSITANPSRTASPEPGAGHGPGHLDLDLDLGPDAFDAGNVFGPEDYGEPSSSVTFVNPSPFGAAAAAANAITNTGPMTAPLGSMPTFDFQAPPLPTSQSETQNPTNSYFNLNGQTLHHQQHASTSLSHLGAHLLGTGSGGHGNGNGSGGGGIDPLSGTTLPPGYSPEVDVKRWVDLDYQTPTPMQPRPILPPTGLDQFPGSINNPFGLAEGNNGGMGLPVGDDFNRFWEQAGYGAGNGHIHGNTDQDSDPFSWLGLMDGAEAGGGVGDRSVVG